MCGSATFAIVVSRICMIVASITATVRIPRCLTGVVATSAGLALAADIDLHVRAEARDQRPRRLFVDRDPHRHALRDLHPIAVRVLRRQHREFGTGAGAEAPDMAFQL